MPGLTREYQGCRSGAFARLLSGQACDLQLWAGGWFSVFSIPSMVMHTGPSRSMTLHLQCAVCGVQYAVCSVHCAACNLQMCLRAWPILSRPR